MSDDLILQYVSHLQMRDRPLRPKTIQAYTRRLRELEAHCASKDLSIAELTEANLREYLAPLQADASGSTSQRFAALSGFFEFLQVADLRDDNPMAVIGRPKIRRGATRPRAGRLSASIAKLSERDQLIVEFLRELGDDLPPLQDVFKISERLPIGPSVMIEDSAGEPQQLQLNDHARATLRKLGGQLGSKRAFEKHLRKRLDMSPTEVLRGSRAGVLVEMSPSLEERIDKLMDDRRFGTAAEDAFKLVEERLRGLVGSSAFGRRAVELALGRGGVLGEAFEREDERSALRDLMAGAFGYYRNRLTHGHVYFPNSMYAKEIVLLCDLLLRELNEVSSDLKLHELTPAYERDESMTEREVRALTHNEFEKWVIRRFRGIYAEPSDDLLGIDGFTSGAELPIQVKQQERVGRPTVDKFETAIERNRSAKGYLVGFSFTRAAELEAERTRRSGRVEVELVTLKDMIHGRFDMV